MKRLQSLDVPDEKKEGQKNTNLAIVNAVFRIITLNRHLTRNYSYSSCSFLLFRRFI